MKRHHVVLVTSKGTLLKTSCETRQEAITIVKSSPHNLGAIIYRDGQTGKRYSAHECTAL